MNAIRVTWLFFKLGVLNELQYRVNFFVALLQAAIALVTGLVVLALVYSHTEELNGWSQSELLCLLGVQILMGGLIKTSIQPNMTRLIEDVREGISVAELVLLSHAALAEQSRLMKNLRWLLLTKRESFRAVLATEA